MISPGNYDITLNHSYQLTKLFNFDIYVAIFIGFWVSVFAVYFLACCISEGIKAAKKEEERIKNEQKREEQERRRDEINMIFQEFQNICRLIHEDLNTFKRPEKMVEAMYKEDLKDLVCKISKMQPFMRQYHKHLVPAYMYYKEMLIKEEKDSHGTE